MKFFLFFILIVFTNAAETKKMNNSYYGTLDGDVASDWLHEAVISNSKANLLEKTLSLANKFYMPTEEEIVETKQAYINYADELFSEGEISAAERSDRIAEANNRELIIRDIIVAVKGANIGEGIAACEYLAALLGEPTKSFSDMLASYEESIKIKFQSNKNKLNKNDLTVLLPAAIQIVKTARKKETLDHMGFIDENSINSWLPLLDELDRNLKNALVKK